MDVRFVFDSSSGKPKVHAKRLPVLIGRSDGEDIKLRISKDSISRRHCEFFRDDEGRVCVRDLESTNGTFLDGRQLKPRVATPVSSGAVIKLGNIRFRVEYQVGPATRSPHDSDTIPIDSATPAGELDDMELEPVGPESEAPAAGPAPTEPIEPDEPLLAAEADAEPAAEGDFGFLADGAPEPEPTAEAWPQADDAPAAGGDGDLDDFLKGLP